MKKVVTVLLAAVMTFGLATTAFAAGSPTADTTVIESVVDANGESVAIVKKETFDTPEQQAAADEVKADPAKALKEAAPEANTSAFTCVSVLDLVVAGDADLIDWPIYVTFSLPEVSAGDTVIVLHYVNGAWQKEEVSVLEAGLVRVKFNTLSPVAFYVEKGATPTPSTDDKKSDTSITSGEKAANNSASTTVASGSTSTSTGSTSTTSTSGTTSPKTGAAPIVEMMLAVAAMAAAGMCVTARRKDA